MKLSGLQIARGLAALSIVYFHSWVILLSFPKDTDQPIQVLKLWGYLSIDFFFAISGFVICLVVSRSKFLVRSFLIKRAFRLYPMYWLCLLAYAATGLLRGPVPTETVGYFLYSATLLPTNGYPFYDVAWSLQHEMLFYVVAAITVPIIGLRGLSFLLFASASTAIWLDVPLHNLPISKYHADFLAGVLAFMSQPHLRKFGSIAPFVIGACGIYFVATRGLADYFCFPFFALITAAANFEGKDAPAERLGDISYSMYLVHPLVFGVGYKIVGMLQPLPIWVEEPIRWAAIIVCVAVSYATWALIEKPMIALGETVSEAAVAALERPRIASVEERRH
ncbi:acyltransferase family protein [Bradyrhizobium tunisiense]|uniref:acyltransferase family protein n=1 Tax=Bradyrhizobium tunisiense TaxID=3278709 RepID=UPI0035DB32EF